MTRITFLAATAAVSLTAFAVTACGGAGTNATGSAGPPKTPDGRSATLGVANNGDLGKILDDSGGRTLYLFAKDTGTKSACTGACASAWPPLRASAKPTVGAGARASIVGKTPRRWPAAGHLSRSPAVHLHR